MDNFLHEYDQKLLFLINSQWDFEFLNFYLTNITDLHKTSFFTYALVPLFIIAVIYFKRRQGLLIIFILTAAIGVSDFLMGNLTKNYFSRLRPEVAGENVVVRAPYFGSSSFPSAHAVNIFCAMVFLSLVFPRFRFPLLFIAFSVAYSRVYVGVHYPSDAIVGSVAGIIFGYLFYKLYLIIFSQLEKKGYL